GRRRASWRCYGGARSGPRHRPGAGSLPCGRAGGVRRDAVQERPDVVILAADQPDHEALVVVVVPRQDPVDRVAVDGDVVGVLVDGRDDGQLDLGVGWLLVQDVDQLADVHAAGLLRVVVRAGV